MNGGDAQSYLCCKKEEGKKSGGRGAPGEKWGLQSLEERAAVGYLMFNFIPSLGRNLQYHVHFSLRPYDQS